MLEDLISRLNTIHTDCNKLCFLALGKYLECSGNIGVFCQNEDEYTIFLKLKDELTKESFNPNQKYFELINAINIEGREVPDGVYTHLYIRKPDQTPYGKYLGDVDFVLNFAEYEELKRQVSKGLVKNAQLYDRPGWDTIQITDPLISSVAYISTKEFAEKVRVKFD